jgi:hypothetical protein
MNRSRSDLAHRDMPVFEHRYAWKCACLGVMLGVFWCSHVVFRLLISLRSTCGRRHFTLRDGVDQLLPVMVARFDGDDRAMPTASPSGNSGARDPDVLGQVSGAGPDHLLPDTVVVRGARP